MIAALYVDPAGVYSGLDDVEVWDEARDARTYAGPWAVVAHPPCARWSRYWFGGPTTKVRHTKGDDGGCFAAALAAVRTWGGVLEHPEASAAWHAFGLRAPLRAGGWTSADWEGGWTCCVEQGHFGHISRKPTWLYAIGCDLPSLAWGGSGQRIPPAAIARYGYEKARRIGVMAYTAGGKKKYATRSATPLPFRDLLLSMARSASTALEAA